MPKRERVVCGPHLPRSAPSEKAATGTGEGRHEEDEADAASHPYDGNRFLALPPGSRRSNSSLSIVFYRRQFPVYPEAAPTEAWDMLRLHLGLVVHQAALDLNLPVYAVAAAVSAFHAVFPGHFSKEELSSCPHVVTRCMAACLFLAGKTSETNLKLREAVNCIDFLQWKLQQQSRLQTMAAGNDSQKAHDESLDSAETTGFANADAKQKTPGSSTVTDPSQESKISKQPGKKAEPTDKGATASASSAGFEEEQEEKNLDKQDKCSDTDEKTNTGATDRGVKSTAAESPSETSSAQKDESRPGTAQSQHTGSENAKSRICGIAAFSRSSRYLKGYVPMGIREYWNVRQECLREEERLLQAIGFSLPLPYLYDVLLEALILLLPTHQEAHLIWAITNDIVATPLPEQFSPPVLIAAAALFAKKLLAVAASISPSKEESFLNNTGNVTSSSTANTTPLDINSAEGEPNISLSDSNSQCDDGTSSSPPGNLGVGDGRKSREALSDSFLPLCKTEPEEESRALTPGDKKEGNAGARLAKGSDPTETSAHAGRAFGESTRPRIIPGNGMLEVLERLDPLLCGSPEYWTLCKSHERRGLERGGSRWARALPPAALGWTVVCPPNSTAATNTYAGPSPISGAAIATQPVFPDIAGPDAGVHSPTDSTADGRIALAVDEGASLEMETDDHAERKRLLTAMREDERQRKLVYVQVGEACARLMEIYSLLLKSRGASNNCNAPADQKTRELQ